MLDKNPKNRPTAKDICERAILANVLSENENFDRKQPESYHYEEQPDDLRYSISSETDSEIIETKVSIFEKSVDQPLDSSLEEIN